MNIVSVEFAGFTFVVLVLYYLLSRRLQNYLLLLASLAFLLSWSIEFASVFVLLTITNYFILQRVAPEKNHHRTLLVFGIGLNILALIYLKYNEFFLPYLIFYMERLGVSLNGEGLKILLPVGLSFYIVQLIAYLLDVSKGTVRPVADPVDFGLFMLYFPRLVSGPIERAREFFPALWAQRIVDWRCMERSLTLILVGLIRKVVIADGLFMLLPEKIFSEPLRFSSSHLAYAILSYSFMIYNDFAGYTSIIRGISGLFGIELSNNFNAPYFSRNFTEFWQRWHITLSNSLRDYVYMPLTRSLLRRKLGSYHVLTMIAPPFMTMFISALWHGASWNMLLWGGFHGLYQVIERIIARWRGSIPPHKRPRLQQGLSILVVFILVVWAWVPFRMEIPEALQFYQGLLRISFSGMDLISNLTLVISLFLAGLSFLMDLSQYHYGEYVYLDQPPIVKALLINAAILLLAISIAVHFKAPPPFVYQEF